MAALVNRPALAAVRAQVPARHLPLTHLQLCHPIQPTTWLKRFGFTCKEVGLAAPQGCLLPPASMPSSLGGMPPPAVPGPCGAAVSVPEEPWRRSRSRAAAARALPKTPVEVTTPEVTAPESAVPVVDIEAEPAAATPKAASKKPVTLDLRHLFRHLFFIGGKSSCLIFLTNRF